jgi:Protein of unknown function (DUF2892)
MNNFFRKNIDTKGRLVRALFALALFIAAVCTIHVRWWLPIPFVIGGVFALFEAVRGWCVMRACGIKTLM